MRSFHLLLILALALIILARVIYEAAPFPVLAWADGRNSWNPNETSLYLLRFAGFAIIIYTIRREWKAYIKRQEMIDYFSK